MLFGKEGRQEVLAVWVTLRQLPTFASQSQCPLVAGQAIKVSPKMGGKALEFVQRLNTLKGLSIELHRRGRCIASRTATRVLFEVNGMRRAVRAQEKPRIRAGGRSQERQAVMFTLENWQTIIMGSDPSHKNCISVEQQMVGGECCRRVGGLALHKLHSVLGGDVFEHNVELRKMRSQGLHVPLNEHRLSVKEIHLGVGDLGVNQEQKTVALHGIEHWVNELDAGDAGVTVGGRPRWVEFASHHASGGGGLDLLRTGHIGQIKRHQWLKIKPPWKRSQDPRSVLHRQGRGGDRWLQIGHDHRSRKLACRVGQYRGERLAISQVQVPVIGPGEGELQRGCHVLIFSWGIASMRSMLQDFAQKFFGARLASLRMVEKLVLAAVLQDAPHIHEDHPTAHTLGKAHLMGDTHHGHAVVGQ